MKKKGSLFFTILFSHLLSVGQILPDTLRQNGLLYFVSDTQQPMMVEKLLLKSNQNTRATASIFTAILNDKPNSLYMLGDVVALGYARKKWKKVDQFLSDSRREGIEVCGILGNHEIMGRRKKGERNFQKRFPMNVSTGYISVKDSVAVVLLNSNFNALSAANVLKQQEWYKTTLRNLDTNQAIRAVIVGCHHSPFTNSKIVKGSSRVQQQFVPDFIQSKKGRLFISGHAHAFEHFKMMEKDFLVIGGGGGLHQPLNLSSANTPDLAVDYKPMFHYLTVKRVNDNLKINSHFLKNDFSGFDNGLSFNTMLTGLNLAKTTDAPIQPKSNK